MEDPLSDGKENVADIFMVCNDETATVPLRESLEKKGYRVCLFPAGTQLKAILSQEKPGLLIYDSKIGDTEGYDSSARSRPTKIGGPSRHSFSPGHRPWRTC